MRLVPRPVATSVDELLAAATHREPLSSAESHSGSTLERVVIGGEPFVLKRVSLADDWIMRCTGDLVPRTLRLWHSGLLDTLPPCLDHAVVGAAFDSERHAAGAAILLRDVGPWLVPDDSGRLTAALHHQFLEHLAALHAAFWGRRDELELTSMTSRYGLFCLPMLEVERALGFPEAVPRLAAQGWQRLPEVAPEAAEIVLPLVADPCPLVEAVADAPATLLHGDWKSPNLGRGPDGRTIVLDWALCGVGPALYDIAHHLALDRDRLAMSKEDTIAAYRAALEGEGVDTERWWDRQLGLSLLGAFVSLGWEKALGDPDELAWWEQQVLAGASALAA